MAGGQDFSLFYLYLQNYVKKDMNRKEYVRPSCYPLTADLEWNLLADASGYDVDDGSDLFNAPIKEEDWL